MSETIPLTLSDFSASPTQILLLEAAERSPPLENNLPITGTTATWYDDLLPDAFPLLNPGTVLRKTVGPAGKHDLLSAKLVSPPYGSCRVPMKQAVLI